MFNELLNEIRKIYKGMEFIPLHAPVLNEDDKSFVARTIESGFVSSVGKEVTLFEEELAKYTGANKAVAVVNGTSALHLAMVISGVAPSDLVITQALTFIATANAIKYAGADPLFIDSDFDTMGLSPEALKKFLEEFAERRHDGAYHKKTGRKISACVPVHVFGQLVRIDEILDICSEWGIAVIEDAAEALGYRVGTRHAGTVAPIGTLSFNGNKIITTGGGGALLFRDEELAAMAKHLSTTAKKPHPWRFQHDAIGFNYRMPNLNASLGCSQLKRLSYFIEQKKKIAEIYEKFFSDRKEFIFVKPRIGSTPNHWLNAVLVSNAKIRDALLEEANTAGIGCRPAWDLMSDLTIYSTCIRDDLKVARELADRLVNLPSGVPV